MNMDNKVDIFIDWLQNELKEQRISIAEFARKMGVVRNLVYKWINRESTMGLDKYFKALEVLGVKEEDILNFRKPE